MTVIYEIDQTKLYEISAVDGDESLVVVVTFVKYGNKRIIITNF